MPCPGRAYTGWALPSNFIRIKDPETKHHMKPKVWVHWEKTNKTKLTHTVAIVTVSGQKKQIIWGVQKLLWDTVLPPPGQSRSKVITRALRTFFLCKQQKSPHQKMKKILYQLTNETKPLFWMGLEVTRRCPLRNNDIKGVKSSLPACFTESGSLDRPQ